MRYKAGDKVRVKTWKQMEKVHGLNKYGKIGNVYPFSKNMEERVNKNCVDRVVTIRKGELIKRNEKLYTLYSMEEDNFCFLENEIEEIIEVITPINRFEILDIR